MEYSTSKPPRLDSLLFLNKKTETHHRVKLLISFLKSNAKYVFTSFQRCKTSFLCWQTFFNILVFFIFASKSYKNVQVTHKRIFGPSFGVCSTHSMVKIYNNRCKINLMFWLQPHKQNFSIDFPEKTLRPKLTSKKMTKSFRVYSTGAARCTPSRATWRPTCDVTPVKNRSSVTGRIVGGGSQDLTSWRDTKDPIVGSNLTGIVDSCVF